MEKMLTTVGNSKAVILPAQMVKRLGEKVSIEETEDGIVIRPAAAKSSFHKAVEKLSRNKAALYKRIELQASDPETMRFYSNASNNFSEVDTDIITE